VLCAVFNEIAVGPMIIFIIYQNHKLELLAVQNAARKVIPVGKVVSSEEHTGTPETSQHCDAVVPGYTQVAFM